MATAGYCFGKGSVVVTATDHVWELGFPCSHGEETYNTENSHPFQNSKVNNGKADTISPHKHTLCWLLLLFWRV